MSKIIFFNSISNIALFLLKLIVAFILTPVIVHSLGDHDYGINEMVLAFIGYMGLLEIGMQPAVTRFVAKYSASDSTKELQRVFSSALFFSLLIGLFVSLLLVAWALIGAYGLVEKNMDPSKYVLFLLIVACQVLVSFPGNVIICMHQGHQRYGLTNFVTAVNTLTGSVILYFFLQAGYGLIFLTAANTIGITIKFATLGFFLKRSSCGEYRFRFADICLSTLKELLVFGGKSFFLGVASSFSKKASPIMIGGFVGPASVVFFSLPSNLISYLANLISAATLSFMPYFSNLYALGDTSKIRNAFLSSSRYLVGLSGCGFLSAGFLGPDFLALWVGTEYGQKGEMVLYLIACTMFVRGLNPFHGRILTGMDHHGALAKIRSFEAGVYLVLGLIIVQFAGMVGVALAILAASLLTEPLVLVLVCRKIEIPVFTYFKQVIFPIIVPMIMLSFFYFLLLEKIRVASYDMFILAGMAGCVVYFLFYSFVSISRQERSDIFAYISKSIQRLRRSL
ncbi:oligosaccharide flippase family protein [Desulfobulbus rhabdoformis]|uniref:oligosaccharide flippase family protein n=1 Tax=Desulfobulbus rhabdoformis TaxID=34032 RepID=UPI001966C7C9|nr:oligosaccharide flippase family protein [Desulfobulbus rhabdoformis]MBM9616713.1 oligosaccharide flippase family protein [Desulfobulbus rhabdoformis]